MKVWDLPTRLFHWLLVASMGAAWWTADTSHLQWHRWSGYAILGLILFRLYWGLVGSETARFGHFLKGPATVARYLGGKAAAGPGHNPLGGWSVAAMLALVGAIVGLGLFAVDVDGFEGGPLSSKVSFDLGREIAGWHELAFNVALGLIALHLAAIVFYLLVRKQNLTGAMITGRLTGEGRATPRFAGPVRFLIGVALAGAATWFIARGLRV